MRRPVFALDDAESDRFILRRAYSQIDPDLPVRPFATPEELFETLDRLEDARWADLPAYLLLDVNLGPVSGLDILAVLRRRWPGLPVVLLSGSARPEDKDIAYRSGAAGFITKPLGIAPLVDRLRVVDEYWQDTMATPERLVQ